MIQAPQSSDRSGHDAAVSSRLRLGHHLTRALSAARFLWSLANRYPIHCAGRPRGSDGASLASWTFPVYGWFTDGFDTPYPREASVLLEACNRKGSATTAYSLRLPAA